MFKMQNTFNPTLSMIFVKIQIYENILHNITSSKQSFNEDTVCVTFLNPSE